MKALIIISIVCVAAALVVVGAVALSGVGINLSLGGQSTGDNPAGKDVTQIENTIKTPVQTSQPNDELPVYTHTSVPAVTQPPVQTAPIPNPSETATVQATAVPTQSPTVTALQQEGIDLIKGTWHGTKSIMFGAVSGDVTAVFDSDTTGYAYGMINAPSFGYENVPLNADLTYNYIGNGVFEGKIGNQQDTFTYDGTKLTITVNPSAMDPSYPSMDIPIDLYRV